MSMKAFLRMVGIGCVSAMPFLVCSVLLIVIVPKFKDVFDALGGDLPRKTQVLLTVSAASRKFWPVTTLLVVGTWLAVFRYLVSNHSSIGARSVLAACRTFIVFFGSLVILSSTAAIAGPLLRLLPVLGVVLNVIGGAFYLAYVLTPLWYPLVGFFVRHSPVGWRAVWLAFPFIMFIYVTLWALFLPISRFPLMVVK